MNDLVSVIIPTYNRSQFVIEAIDSVLCQTYPNIELIVVNDGSTDDTEEKLQPYMDGIIYIKKENGGISSAVNAGLRVAKGKYIARLDDDDLFMPDKIEKQVKVFEENPDVGLIVAGCFITDEIGRTISVRKAPDFSEYGPFLTLLLPHYAVFQPSAMVRRECHDKVGFYKDTFAEDYEMFLRISRYWKVAIVDQPLAKCRRHSGNITIGMFENEEFQQDIRDFTRDILDHVPLTELFPAIGSTSDPYRESCAHAARGSLYLYRKIFDRAEADFLKALELYPANPIPLLWLGISARSQEDFRSAEEYFNKVQESDELYPIAQNARDLITAIRKNKDEDSSLLRREITKEYRKLFRITFDGISGKAAEKISPHGSATTGLKPSRYAVIIDNYPQNGKHLVFNTFTHAMVNIGDDLKDLIHNPDRPVGEDALKDIRMLKKMGVLVNQEFDETEMARKWYNTSKSDMSGMRATILTTYDCNFACKYCIEEGVKKPVSMDDGCSDALADWLMNRTKENGTKQILLSFYGGEPLLNTRPMYRISEKLQRFAIDNEVLVSSFITTNGSLLDSELLRDLTKYGLASVKVTIDGEREIHDARRPFKSGKGSFDVIMGNIQKIPETVKLTIQANLDSENMGGFPRLLDFFERSGLKDRIDNLTISPVVQSLGLTSMPAAQETDCVKLSGSQIDDDLMIYMKKLMVERGFKSRSDGINYTICSMNRGGAMVVIDPLGDIYTCPAFVGREGFSIGNVCRAELDQIEELPAAQLEGCFQCTYFPICGGGCRYTVYMLYGDHNRISCDREVIENKTKELIKFRYDRKMKQRTIA